MGEIDQISVVDLMEILLRRYHKEADDFRVSIGHIERPEPTQPISIFNMPEVASFISLTIGTVRKWYNELPEQAEQVADQ